MKILEIQNELLFIITKNKIKQLNIFIFVTALYMSFTSSSYSSLYSSNKTYSKDLNKTDYYKNYQFKDYSSSYNSLSTSNISEKYQRYIPNSSNLNNQLTNNKPIKKQMINLRNTTGNLTQLIKKINIDQQPTSQYPTPHRKYSDYNQKQTNEKDNILTKTIQNNPLSSYDYSSNKQIRSSLNISLSLSTDDDIKKELKKLRQQKQQRRKQRQNSFSTINLITTSNNYINNNDAYTSSSEYSKNPQHFTPTFRKGSGDFYGMKKQGQQYNFLKKNKVNNLNENISSPRKQYDFQKKYQDLLKKYQSDQKKTTLNKNIQSNEKYFKLPASSVKYTTTIDQKSLNLKKNMNKVSINDFKLGKNLGQGKFGTVYQAIHKSTKSLYALKKIPKQMIKNHYLIDQFILQIKIQSYMNHENLLALHGFFQDTQYIYLILDYMEEGTLYSYMKKQKKLEIKDTSIKIKEIAKAIIYMHENGIAHRDIKPENVVMSNGTCKLCDFGWATICDQRRKTYCGTFDYAAPQILQGNQYDMSVDLWCLGVLTYELLVGKAPFYHIKKQQTKKKILNVQSQPIPYPTSMPPNAVDFIDRLLRKDPQQRLKIEELLNHPFLTTV